MLEYFIKISKNVLGHMVCYRKFSEFWATIIILLNNQWEIWANFNLSQVTITQNMDLALNLADKT